MSFFDSNSPPARLTNSAKYLVVIAGPTAVGKTDVAIKLATHFKSEIISADSRQFYREMSIGTAKPDQDQLKSIKHHFIGQLSISDYFNVSVFENEVIKLLKNLFINTNIIFLVGGSGLYIDAVCKGIDELPDPEEELREDIKQLFAKEGIEALRSQLKILDPVYYQEVDLANPKRIMRALEVCLTTGKPYSSLRVNQQSPRTFNIIKIGLTRERETLYDIINHRVDVMMDMGLLNEVKGLLPFKELNALNTVGYKELFAYLAEECSLTEAIEKIKTNSRRYAKRQLTWFRRYDDITWFDANQEVEIVDYLKNVV